MPKFDIDIPVIEGVDRRSEPNDKAPFIPAYLPDMQMQQVGEWRIRPGTEELFPDRGDTFDRTTPLVNRGVDQNYIFYGCHKRKTIVEATSGGVTYVFLGKIRYSWDDIGTKVMRLQIYRGHYEGNDFDVTWDEWPADSGDWEAAEITGDGSRGIHAYTYSSALASLNRPYQPYDEVADAAYFAFSMVVQGDALFVALVTRDDSISAHSTLNILKISNIYADSWGGNNDGTPTWELFATIEDYNSVDDPNLYLTNDVDIEAMTLGVLDNHFWIVYGSRNEGGSPEYTLRYRRVTRTGASIVVFAASTINDGSNQSYGCVIGATGASTFKIGLISVAADGSSATKAFDSTTGLSTIDSTGLPTYGNGDAGSPFKAYDWSLFGPALAIDGDYTVVWGFASESLSKLKFKCGSASAVVFPDQINEPFAHFHDYRGWKNTQWDMIVKDGVLTVYYGSLGKAAGLEAPTGSYFYSIRRRDLVFDSADADYDDLDWTASALVAEKQVDVEEWVFPCFVSTYRAYSSSIKRTFAFVAFFSDKTVAESYSSLISFIRQDVAGYVGATHNLEIKSVWVYPAQSVNGIETVAVIQTEDIAGKTQFWERVGDRWQLWKGQMDEGNSMDLRPVVVQDRARFYDHNFVCRAGCGNGSDVLFYINDEPASYQENRPPWYGFIDRYFFNNDSSVNAGSDSFRLRERRMSYEEPTPPIVNESHEQGSLAEIALIGENLGTGTASLALRDASNTTGILITSVASGVEANRIFVNFTNNSGTLGIIIKRPGASYAIVEQGYASNAALVTAINNNALNDFVVASSSSANKPVSMTGYLSGGIDEPEGTDTNDDLERYARFSPTDDKGASFDLTATRPNPPGGSFGQGWYNDLSEGSNHPRIRQEAGRVAHQYKVFNASDVDANTGGGGTDADLYAQFKQAFIEGWFYFAFRLDSGQITQFTPQFSDDTCKFGFEITGIMDDLYLAGTIHGRMARISLKMRRWSWAAPDAMNPRITSVIIGWAEKRWSAETKYTANPKIIKEIDVSKRDPFKDEPWNGNSEWSVDGTEGMMSLVTYVDWKNYSANWITSQDGSVLVGHATPVIQFPDRQKAYVDGYKYAVVVGNKIFRFNVKMNGQIHEEWAVWSANQQSGEVSFEAPDVNGLEWLRAFTFKLQGGSLIGDDAVVAVGDRDVEWGRVLSDVFSWRFGGKRKELGTISPDSIAQITSNGRSTKILFLSKKAGVQEYDLYSDAPVTDQIIDSFVDGRNPSSQSLTTRKGVRDLTASNAMIIHLPDYRLLLVHFPTDNVTWVRDFEAEEKLGKPVWMEWHLAQNPTAWCVHPDGYLVFTNGNKLYRLPSADGAADDAGTAISAGLRIANVPVPARGWGVPLRLVLDYDLRSKGGGTPVTCKVQIIKDNGERSDNSLTFAATTARTVSDRGFWLPKRANKHLSIAIDLVTPSDCSDFRIYGIYFAANVHKSHS